MITVGVDLATEPVRTAMAVVSWQDGAARVDSLALGATDAHIVAAAGTAEKLGLDCPLGWPDDFLEFLTAHHTGHVVAPVDVAGIDWRRRLANRETDRAVRQVTGLTPLSVAADRISLTAMRAAGILATLAAHGRPVDRAGTGVVVEVYPAASLKLWGLAHRGYKRAGNRAAREQLFAGLVEQAPWLDLAGHAEDCLASDDALDAVVAALTARAVAVGCATTPDEDQRARATREGWIALPTGPLERLVDRPTSRQVHAPGSRP